MANRVALLTPLLAWTAALLAAHWPASVMASDFCGRDVSLRSKWCRPQDVRDDLWEASIECSDDAITIQVQQTGDRSSIDVEYYREVLIQCTNGTDQDEISVNISCNIQEERLYTRTISDIGIESGWTCSFSGCFQVEFNNGDRSYYRTAMDSCTLPGIDPTTTEEPTTTSTEADVTEPTTTSIEAGVTMTMGTITSTEVDSGTDATVPPMLHLSADPTQTALVIIPVIVVLLGLIMVTSLMILFINSRMKQQKARKTALLILDRNNMVFDPDYTPGIHIDKQSYYTHRTSMISNMDYLHFVVEKPSQYPADVQVVTFDENSYTIDSSFDHDLNMSNSKQHSSTMVGATKDMVINPQEFPGSGTSGYIISGDSNGFTSPQQMDTTELEFQSPSDSASELTQSCGGCQSSGYIGDAQLGNPSLMYDNVISASQETSSEDTLSFFTPEDDPVKEAAGVVGLDRSSYPSSSSSAGYVEQLNSSNQPLTRDDDNVFEPTHQQGDGYVQSQHPIPIASSTATFNDTHQTSGYIVDLQNTHQLHTNLQDTEVACLDLDDMNCSVSNSTTDATQPTHVVLKSCDQTSTFPLDMPQLTNTDGYIVNEHPTATTSEDCETPELSIDLDCENTLEEGETDCEEPSHDVYGSSVEDQVNGRSLDKPCSPDKISSQGYITTEDIDMTKFTSREIVVPSNQVSPSQIEPGFTVHLDFNNGIDSCRGQEKDEVGYVCNSGCSRSGIETDRNRDMTHHSQSSNQMAIDGNGYVANQPTSILGTDKREQYVSYDFHSMSSELRDSHSTSVTPEPTQNPDLGQVHIQYQVKSSYYPASDMSSGYLSGSSVSGDTSVYLGMDKFEQLDLYNYK